jgi:hypothetical protein
MKKIIISLISLFVASATFADGLLINGTGLLITNANLKSSWYGYWTNISTNVYFYPQPPTTTTGSSWTPDFSLGMVHQITLNGNGTISAPTGLVQEMVGQFFTLLFIQDATGGRQPTMATNFWFGDLTTIPTNRLLILNTNIGYRSYYRALVTRTNSVRLDMVGYQPGYAP